MDAHRVFASMSELLDFAEKDKHNEGAGVGQQNRYPIRFVLFENFEDFSEFVDNINGAFHEEVYTLNVGKWMDEQFPDTFITRSEMEDRIIGFVKRLPTNDVVIAPFSEVARFYNNLDKEEFEALIRRIRIAEPPAVSQERHQRVYIPIIGMQSKMGKFFNDPNIHIWELRPQCSTENYQLILAPGTTYGVKGLENSYSVCSNVSEWLSLWRKASTVKRNIISSSRALYDRAKYAQPDNAFSYTICDNAYEFLTKGLELEFGNITYRKSDTDKWETLASQIDLEDFNFELYVNHHFGTFGVNNESEFVKAWYECENAFDYWLIAIYYQMKFGSSTYLGRVLAQVENLTTSELFSQIAVAIFDESQPDFFTGQRRTLMAEAAKHGVTITAPAEQRLKARLQAIATDPNKGYYAASKLLTPLTKSEKQLMIEWVGRGNIGLNDIEKAYPELYRYLRAYPIKTSLDWLNSYVNAYRQSKIHNVQSDTVINIINEQNGNAVKFHGWYDDIKTVKTFLNSRPDIEVVYWLDGLGLDWIPFIASIIEKHLHDGIFLNEIYVAASELPTRTENNKIHIQSVAGERLKKIGDIDAYAHTPKSYPNYIIEELHIVANAIEDVLNKYNGKKIAFVSDHGISYMAQLSQGLNLAGIEIDHAGRVAVRTSGSASPDANYVILEDGKTMCALNHKSLGPKVNSGVGAHGGATPEEVLVPIIIVSNQKNASNFTAQILSDEINGTNPIVSFNIKGLSSVDIPEIEYNGITYSLNDSGAGTYTSEKLNLVDTCKSVTLRIGENFIKKFSVSVNTGANEEDLFGDF